MRVRSADGLGLHAVSWGDHDRPAVVLLHGYPDTSAVWKPIAELLAADHHVVAYDVRGAGASDASRRPGLAAWGLDRLIDDLAAVLEACVPDRSVHLVGHDWGSLQGWEAVTSGRFDGRITGFTSISGPALDHVARRARQRPSPAQAARSWYVAAFHLPVLAPVAWRLGMARVLRAQLDADPELRTDEAWPAPTLAGDAARGVNLYRANVVPRMVAPGDRTTDVPVELVVARRDRFIGEEILEGLEHVAPRLHRHEVDAGHWVVRSHPEEVARIVAAAASAGAEA